MNQLTLTKKFVMELEIGAKQGIEKWSSKLDDHLALKLS